MAAAATKTGALPGSPNPAGPAQGQAAPPKRPIPLDLAPLLAPYRSRERLAVRVERMPIGARLSAGRNNGDDSWTLATDELDGLEFEPGVKFDGPHTLTIRIIRNSFGSATIAAAIDYVVSPDGAAAVHPPAPLNGQAEDLQRLRDALHDITRRLADSEAALLEARQDGEVARAELELARDSWQRQTAAHLEDAAAEAMLRQREAEEGWRAAEASRLAVARAQWQAKTEAALAEARRAAEAGRLAGEAAQRQLRSERDMLLDALRRREAELAEARNAVDAGRASGEAVLRELHHERDALLETLRTREQELTEARHSADEVRSANEAARLRLQSELDVAQQTLRAREAELTEAATAQLAFRKVAEEEQLRLQAELADSRARLRQQDTELEQLRSGNEDIRRGDQEQRAALAAAEARWKASEREVLALKAQCARADDALQAAAENQLEIARLRTELDARDRSLTEAKVAMLQMQAIVSASEERRVQMLASSEARWKAQAEAAAGDMQARTDRADAALAAAAERAAGDAAELQRLGGEVAKLRSSLEEREAELEQARIAAAVTSISEERGETLDALEAALAEMTERCELAEAALAEMRTRSSAQGVNQIPRMQDEIDTLQAMLAQRETEMSRLRKAADHWYELQNAEASQGPKWTSLREAGEDAAYRAGGVLRDAVLVIAIVLAAVFLYPRLYAALPYAWQAAIPDILTPYADVPEPAATVPSKAASAPAIPREAVVTGGVNLRAGPSGHSEIVSTLRRGAIVTPLETRGHWTHVHAEVEDGRTVSGWVYETYLTPAEVRAEKR